MKTSFKISIAFTVFIFSSILVLFVDAKQHEKEIKGLHTYREFALATFNVIVAEKGADLHIDQSDSSFVKVEYIKNQKELAKMYVVKNDTLFVYGGLRLFVKCKNINAIIGHKPFWIGMNGFTPDSLSVKMTGGPLYINNNVLPENKIIKKLFDINVDASDSAYVQIKNANIRNLTVKSDNAVVNNYCNTKHLNARLINRSRFFNLNIIEILDIERDTASQVQINSQNF